MIQLAVKQRVKAKKSDVKQLRRSGEIPAILYSGKGEGTPLTINAKDFDAISRSVNLGQLATTRFELNLDGKKIPVIAKEIQYDRTNYRVIHVDFMVLEDQRPVRVKVPIECTGLIECVGLKQGGFLRQVLRFIDVSCLPKDLPTDFKIDVREMVIGQSKKVADLQMPKGVNPLATEDKVLVVIAKH